MTALALQLRHLRCSTMAEHYLEVAEQAQAHGQSHVQYLQDLVDLEMQSQGTRRIARWLKDARLPVSKTPDSLDVKRLPGAVQKRWGQLVDGSLVERGDNLLVFGLPGRGKTHLVSALGHAWVRRGYRVLFAPAYELVQRLLAAKRDLRLEQELSRLDSFSAVVCDDIGYIQQSREEMEVLFTFFAQRYERKSVVVTSNLVFSQWDQIFKDPMTTAAAIDRLVHHAVIVEMTGKSHRMPHASKGSPAEEEPLPNP